MKRSARGPVAAARLGLAASAVAVGVSGCMFVSPTTITTPYPAGDGSNATIDDGQHGTTVQLSNFLAVGTAVNSPAVVIGAVSVEGPNPVRVQIAVFANCSPGAAGTAPTALAQTIVTVAPGVLAEIGPSGTSFLQLPKLPDPPGTDLCLRAVAPSGGTQIEVPVLPPTAAQYATITPTPAVT